LVDSITFDLGFLKLDTSIDNNKEERVVWAKLIKSGESLLISPERGNEIATLPSVPTQAHNWTTSRHGSNDRQCAKDTTT
jgi:hypothetical protein